MEGRSRGKTATRGSLILLLAGVAAATFPSASGCKTKSEEIRNCDINALFKSSCDGSVCHGSDAPRANLDLVSPGLEQRLFHVQGTTDCDERKLIFPGKPEDSLLYNKVAEDEPICGKRMPIDKKLSVEELACLRDYIINAGTDTDVASCETCGSILCVDFNRDPNHCGRCDRECDVGQVCGDGECINPCLMEETLCGSSCVTVEDNDSHCGGCGHRCGPGSSCQQGVCTCDPSTSDPNGGGGMTSAPGEPVSFTDDILPVLENSCSGSDCHSGADREAPLGLEPAEAYGNLINVAAEDCSGRDLVSPGSPDQSYLIEKLMGGTMCAGDPMPLGEKQLPTAGIRTIVDWICAGAPDN